MSSVANAYWPMVLISSINKVHRQGQREV